MHGASDRGGTPQQRMRPRRWSVATRLAAAVIAVSALTVAASSVIGLVSGERAAERLTEQRLVSIRGAEQFEVLAYVDTMQVTVARLAESPATAASIRRFSTARAALAPLDARASGARREVLLDHYSSVVAPQLAATTGRPAAPSSLLPGTGAGVLLQYSFLPEVTGRDPVDVVDPALGDDVVDGDVLDDWAAVHADLHPVYRDVVERFGLDDLYLIDDAGEVLYSVRKQSDFATSLQVGPHSGRALGASLRRSATAAGAGEVRVVDMSAYPPAGGRPVWFLVAPVIADDVLEGVLAVRISVDVLNSIVAGTDGLGSTGEVYLAGSDRLLRTDPRAFREAPADYREAATAAGVLDDDDAAIVAATGTTVLVQRADGDAVAAALADGPGIERRTDHLGRDAVMAFAPLGLDGVDWVVVAQLTDDEAMEPVTRYRRVLLLVATVLVALVTFGAVAWASRAMRPVRLMSERLHDPAGVRDGGRTIGSIDTHCDEFARLADGLATMEVELADRAAAVEEAHAERKAVVRSLLPAAIVRRLDAGDRSVVERPPAATTAVVVMHGSEVVDDAGVRRRLDRLVNDIDAVAARHGVERVKLVGDSCYCAVGHQQLYLDHARRAADFAADLVEANPDVAIGLASGPVNVGLGGSVRLAYDIWGPTVNEAYLLARQARPSTVLTSDSTRERLPDRAASSEATE